MDWVLFVVFGLLGLGGAAMVVLARNPVHSALSLVVTLFCMAVFFVMQDAHFLAAVQVIVYAGAIVVLFLFVIMLLGVDKSEATDVEPLRGQRPAAVVIGLGLLAELFVLSRAFEATGAAQQRGAALGGTSSNVEKIARSLFTDFLWPFEITSILLIIGVVGAVVLAKRPQREGSAASEDFLS
jgi:NADH-quinone oxidoreductase subunit J